MINPREFRIGNFVEDINGVVIGYIQTLDLDTCHVKSVVDGVIYTYNYENLKPIPLTEEWLIKFGFEFDQLTWALDSQFEWIGGVLKYCQGKSKTIYVKCKYIHQLQNLYMCLVGQELELKPNL